MVLFIDLVLIKPQVGESTTTGLSSNIFDQVYRHLLYNRLGRTDNKLDPSILRLGILLVLFDVYITWARIERLNSSPDNDGGGSTEWALADAPIIMQYLFFLTMNILATLAQHASIRFLSRFLVDRFVKHPTKPEGEETDGDVDYEKASPSAISTALLVSSCTKLFPILLVIWPTANSDSDTNEGSLSHGLSRAFASNASNYVGWVVLLNNIEALLILLDCGYMVATGLAFTGLIFRQTVEDSALALVGLKSSGSFEVFSTGLSLIRRVMAVGGWG